MRTGALLWILLLFAAGFARYAVLAVRDGDKELTVVAAVALVPMCVLAVAELFGWLW